MDKTFFTYCRYLRALDLDDLGQLFEADKFRSKIEQYVVSELGMSWAS